MITRTFTNSPSWTESHPISEVYTMTDDPTQTPTPKPEDPQPEPPTEPTEPPLDDEPTTEEKP